ncbi:LAQU0S13e02938g1_1 [Lachancea quebecensis]|uniref:LAQU0S13e02938g1_1 n=1 Tax=Lachancea quebecensis TaxID=1654605 RepID=A0A0P1KV02_9SACH|nr:LAQU0S13e02938g1_1 [Lachancea quebecensis]
MAGANPLPNLFPNYLHISSDEVASCSADESNTLDSKNTNDDGKSSDTNYLKELLSNFKGHDLDDYKARLGAQKFYLSEEIERKMTALGYRDYLDPEGEEGSVDFQAYNRKVEREYLLRKKMESIIQNRGREPLEVLDSDALYSNFVAGDEAFETNAKPSRARQRFHKIMGSPQKHSPSIFKELLSRTKTSDTQIIDLEKNHDGIIDERIPAQTYEYQPGLATKRPGRSHSILRRLNIFPYGVGEEQYSVQRKLGIRHIQMIATGATMGVGLFLNSGKALSIAGPFGFVLGFSICGSIALATMLSFTEIAALIPISSGFSGLASRFVEDAFGFALGWSYWLTYAITFANQIVASNFMLSYYENMRDQRGATVGFVTFFLIVAVIGNLLDVRILAELTYGFTFFKILVAAMMIFAMIVLNAGAGRHHHQTVGFRFWDASKSPENLTYGLFRPTFDLRDIGSGSKKGIPGTKGRFLSVLVVIIASSFSFSGVELGFVACGEAANPRKSLPSATKRTFTTIITLYLLSIFVVSLNVYSGDSRLLRYYTAATQSPTTVILHATNTNWQIDETCNKKVIFSATDFSNGSQSPWVLALESFGLCTFSSVFNAILVVFGVTSEFSSLYASSRTLYSMATQEKAPAVFKLCSRNGVPYAAVLFSGLFGALAYLTINSRSLEIFQALANISGATISIIWLGLNVSFLRFYYALKKRTDIISRDDPSFPYRSPFQPFVACYGLVGSFLIVLLMGFSNFLHGFWNTKMFFSSYGGLMFFTLCYLGYKIFGTSKLQRLDQLDLDSGRREMDRMIWTEHREYTDSLREKVARFVTWLF